MNVQWWCSARAEPWDGSWQAYPGVWLFVALVAFAFWRLRKTASGQPVNRSTGQPALIAAIVLLWATLDWPIGPLGAGYLAWIHSIQFVMLAMVIPPLLLFAIDRERVAAYLSGNHVLHAVIGRLTQPLFAMIVFAVTMVLTHLPRVVDALMVTQVGAFAIDLAWLVVGLIFWWPIVVRVPERAHFPPLVQMLYVFFGTQPHLYVAMWLLAADYPVYGTFELAPRITSAAALTDQQIAGAIMLGFGATYVLGVISVLFFRWMGREERPSLRSGEPRTLGPSLRSGEPRTPGPSLRSGEPRVDKA